MSQAASLESIAHTLHTLDIHVSYGCFGSPYIVVGKEDAQTVYDLNDLAQKAYAFSKQPNKTTAMEYMLAGYLVGRVCALFELADQEVARAGCITRIFICIKQCLVTILACFINIRERHDICYLDRTVVVPAHLVRKDPVLLAQTSPLECSDASEEARFTPERAMILYPIRYIIPELA